MRKKPQAVYKPTTMEKVIRRSMGVGFGVVLGLGIAAVKPNEVPKGQTAFAVDTLTQQDSQISTYRQIRENYDIHALILDLDEYGAGQGVAVADLQRLRTEMHERVMSILPEGVSQHELLKISREVVVSFADALGDGSEARAMHYHYEQGKGGRERGQVVCAVSGIAKNYTRTEILNMLTHMNLDMEAAQIDLDQFREMVVNHELAHCQNSPHQYPRLINETLADSYAALMAIQKHGNTDLAEKFMHIRTVGLLNGSGNYVTSPALAKVIEQGQVALKNGELEGLAPAQIFDRAMEMAMGPEHQREQAIADYTEQAERLYSGRQFLLKNFDINYTTGIPREKSGKHVLFEYQSPAIELFEMYQNALVGIRGESVLDRTPEERFADDMQEMLIDLTPQEQLQALNFQKFNIRNTMHEREAAAKDAGVKPPAYTDVYGFSADERLAKIDGYIERIRGTEGPVLVAERETNSREL